MDNSSVIQFELSADQRTILAVYKTTPENTLTINSHWIKDRLTENGYGDLHLLEEGAATLIDEFKKAEGTSGKVCIAEKRDATVSIYVTKDRMGAYLTIHPAEGGSKVTLDLVKRALAEKGIRFGFIPEAIKSAILKGQAEETLIAAGTPVENGENAKFRCLLPEIKIRTPQIAENGNVDFRDLGEILVVQPGQELMRREPSTMGKPGKNIFGEMVNPRRGQDAKFAMGLTGVETDYNDPNILKATVTGQPVIVENGVNVEDTMSVPVVNLSSGNIIFDGSVIVNGDIEHGMKVHATGDIHVGGAVESAELRAGGDVVVHGSIVGHGDVRDKQGNFNEETAQVYAEGSISAKFVENVFLEAKNKILIRDWVIKSELNATNEIIIGDKTAKKGQIIGGFVTSGLLVKALNIGAQAGVKTVIRAGKELDIDKELDKVTTEIQRQNKALKDLHKANVSLKNNPTKQAQEMLKKSLKTKQHMEEELIDLEARRSILKKEQKRLENSKVVVTRTIYNDSVIQIGKYEKSIREDLGSRSFMIKDGKLVQMVE